MNKSIIFGGVMACLLAMSAQADDSGVLQHRLKQVNSFYATFVQTVSDAAGKNIQQGQGEMWVKRPDLFNWHMIKPDQTRIISDGKTLWYYNPFVDQVTASWLKNATNNTPFMLIARNQAEDWKKYHVKQSADHFTLTPKQASGNLKQFTLDVTNQGVIKQFTSVEQDGQRSQYQLQSENNQTIDNSKFIFNPPKGVDVDDQRH